MNFAHVNQSDLYSIYATLSEKFQFHEGYKKVKEHKRNIITVFEFVQS